MMVIAQFCDLNNQDRFVWLRGFRDMASRTGQLQAFYGGPVWKAHRDAANATMIDRGNAMEENELRDAMQDHGAVVSTSGSRKVFKPSSMLRIGSVFGNAARFIYYPSWLRVTCSAN
jgi:hypothetical protein